MPKREVIHRHIYPWAESKAIGIDPDANEAKSSQIGEGWEKDSDWEMAPATSHCWGFKFLDAREREKKVTQVDPAMASRTKIGVRRPPGTPHSVIYVRFKDKDYSWRVAAEYAYRFSDHVFAEKMFKELRESPHPYAEVVHKKFILGGVPYERIS